MISSRLLAALPALAAGLITACIQTPEPAPPPAPSASQGQPPPAPPPPPSPREPLPALHPCVPDFIQKELHACEPGAEPADYSAVANAMAAMAAAGPAGPRPREPRPVPRALEPLEEKAVSVARAFLCAAPGGELDDEHATAAFDLGRLYLGANHFEEAVVFLRDAAILDPASHAEVEYAARFLLDAMRPLAESRPECVGPYSGMVNAVHAHVCEGADAAARAESCASVAAAKAALSAQ